VLGSNVEAVVNCLDSHNSRKTRSTMFGKLFSYNTETGSARNDALPGPPVQKVWLEGCKFSDFKLGPILGTGSFGRVHLAHYIPTNQVCATKSLSKAMIVKSKQVAHVKQEKSILQRLSYPFIVNLIGCCQDDKCIHLVLEYICGYVLVCNLR
jgi:serine/threonine protein kinase